MIIYIMYIAPGQGQTTPWEQTFDVNRKPLSLCPFVAGLKQIALKSDFIYIFSMFHHMYRSAQEKSFFFAFRRGTTFREINVFPKKITYFAEGSRRNSAKIRSGYVRT